MPLITNNKSSLFNGVNQQAAEYRLDSQVEEMINAYPTIDKGLLKRNPTTKKELTQDISYSHDMWTFAYDRGLSGDEEEKYSINIIDGVMEIINIISGKVYKEANGLSSTNEGYLLPFTGSNGYSATTIKDTTFIINKAVVPEIDYVNFPTPDISYLKEGYLWLKSANPSAAYTYSVTITDAESNILSTSSSATTTTAAATALAANISADANFSAVAVGSTIKITGVNKLVSVDAGDSYGDQASFGWYKSIQYSTDLPKNFSFTDSMVEITGSGTNTFATYWLTYVDSSWIEIKEPSFNGLIDKETMPHILIRNTNDTFTFEPYDKWAEASVGDIDSNPYPSFLNSNTTDGSIIKDIFFFKNRLGFVTERDIIMSEVGKYGNFFRTSTSAVLDSDPIDTTVDTTQAISLEFATYIEDSIMLFSDKAQFKLDGGRILSPKSVQISQTSSYEINKDVRPVFMNDKIFFCAIRGDYTALMQYEIKSTNTTSEAIDITAHVQTYIPSDIIKLSGSPINNMLFLTSASDTETVYVYKYYDDGDKRIQSAWFKWSFNGEIYNCFSLGKQVNILIKRFQNISATNWVVGDGVWDNSKLWDNSQLWVMSPESLTSVEQFESMPIVPVDIDETFLDNAGTDNETLIDTLVALGEWVYSSNGVKDIRGHLKVKTIQISSENGSVFELIVKDNSRNSSRTIASKYTVNRRPMIYGDATNSRVEIHSSFDTGFKINTISFEGALNKRAKRL